MGIPKRKGIQVSTVVRHWPGLGFFVVGIHQHEIRYFNGRKYTVNRRLEHYVHPHAHGKDFSNHTIFVHYHTRRYNSEIIRHSEVNW